ncbi:MAG: HNH endonuclease [Bdellovibrio sp.]
MNGPLYFAPASEAHQKKQKAKARELRASQWWRNQLGKGVCYHCELKFTPKELTMDHLVPIARGGLSDKSNCVPSCKECNNKKGHKTRAEMAMDDLEKQNSDLERLNLPDSQAETGDDDV